MGLDTTHDCWSGPYGAFMRWRTWLAAQIGIPLNLMEGFYAWEWGEDDLSFDRDYSKITRISSVHETGQMYWDTLSAMEPLGRAIPWEIISHPLVPLLRHSDCDGELSPDECAQIAQGLGAIIKITDDDTKFPTYEDRHPKAGQLIWDRWEEGRSCYDGMIPACRRFRAGCLKAHELGEAVLFH